MPTMMELVTADARRVFEAEQASNIKRLCSVRLAVAGLAVVVSLVTPTAVATRISVVVYLLVGVAMFALARSVRSSRRWLAWAVPLIDVPLVAITQTLQWAEHRVSAQALLFDAIAIDLAFVVLASLSMVHAVVVVTAGLGLLSVVWVATRAQLTLLELDWVLVAFVASASALWWMTRRTFALALEMRRQEWAGRYRIGARLGAGGMAEVFEATLHRPDGTRRKVALKRMLPALASRDDAQQLFMRELELGAMMAHPNIVQMLDSGIDEAGPFLVMEFVDGRPLSALLKHAAERGERLSPAACLTLADQLLRALEHVHGRRDAAGRPLGLMHRDLNPPNVLVSFNGEAKIGDFGIARGAQTPAMTASGAMRGKRSYGAPEQLQGATLTPALDLFALGILLAEAALGAYPFDGVTEAERMAQQLAGRIGSLEKARPELPEAFAELVRWLLQPEVARRCPSAGAALERLHTLKWDVQAGRQELGRLARDDSSHEATTRTL